MPEMRNFLRSKQDVVYAVCRRVLRHAQDAEDAAQEALLKISRGLRTIRDGASVDTWVRRVALNTALDAARRRRTRAEHETGAPGQGRERDALVVHRAIAELPGADQGVILQHYFQRRTLRELADEAGCTEQAVWKRIERAKSRLRTVLTVGLGAAAGPLLQSALEASTPVSAPRDLVSGAVLGGAPAKGLGIGALVAIPVLLLGTIVVGAAVVRKSPAPREVAADEPSVTASKAPETTAVAEKTPPKAVTIPPPVGERIANPPEPYPWEMPPRHWPEAKRRTWKRLRDVRVTIDKQDVPLSGMIGELSRLTEVFIGLDQGVRDDAVSFKVSQITVDGALRLMLGPRGVVYEIQPDGTVRIGAFKPFDDPRDAEIGKVAGLLRRMQLMWRGGVPAPEAQFKAQENLKAKQVLSRHGGRTVEEDIDHLRDASGLTILLDAAIRNRIPGHVFGKRRPVAGQMKTVAAHLEDLCREAGLGFCTTEEGVVLLTSPERAGELRREWEVSRATRRRVLEALHRPSNEKRAIPVTEWVRRLRALLGIPVYTTKTVWESDPVPSEETWRRTLDRFASERAFRWLLKDGSLLIMD